MSKRYLSWILSAALLFSGAPGEVFAAAKPAVKGVSITNIGGKKLTLKKGAVFQLKVSSNCWLLALTNQLHNPEGMLFPPWRSESQQYSRRNLRESV